MTNLVTKKISHYIMTDLSTNLKTKNYLQLK